MNLWEARQRLPRGAAPAAAPASVPDKYRTFWPRLWAGVIDGVVFLPLSLIDNWMAVVIAAPAARAAWFVASSFLCLGYSIGMHAKFGQTLGKMVTRVKVLDVSETKLSFRGAFLRDSVPLVLTLAYVVLGLPRVLGGKAPIEGVPRWDTAESLLAFTSMGWFALELITMLLNSKRRALHDFIAGSVVVRTGRAAAPVGGNSAAIQSR